MALVETMGDVGWPLTRPDDGQALAKELVSVLEQEAANEARKDAGVRRFKTVFTAEAASEGMARLYQDALRDARRIIRNPPK